MKNNRGKKMIQLCVGLIIFILIIVAVFMPPSLGRIDQFKDQEGNILAYSIAEKIYVEINGVEQGMIIKGENSDKPVLLIIHGGPGLSDYFLSTIYQTGIEKEFIVCYWDQRGTGLSYQKDIDIQTMNKEQFISDTIEVTHYLRTRFNQEKIYLLGHSWGTYIGLMSVKQNPDLYHAYIAMSQVVDQIASEKEAYAYMLEQYRIKGNKNMVDRLSEYQIMDTEENLMNYRKSGLRDEAMHELGVGTMHQMKSVVSGLFFPSLKCTEYSIKERINIWRGKVYSSKTNMLFTIDTFDARVDVKSLDVPIYFFAGIHDYTTSYTLQKAFYESIDAPIKGFYTFKLSAHSPLFEEPEFALSILIEDVMKLSTSLADPI